MPVVSQMVHPRGLSFQEQKRVVVLRDVKGLSFPAIAKKVKNLSKEEPSVQCVMDYYDEFNTSAGFVKTKYHNCGRQSWKFTAEVEKWIVKRLIELRLVCVCTSVTLQHALARELGVKASSSGIRKVLNDAGYKWLPKSSRRVYSAADRRTRVAFAKQVVRMTAAELRKKFSLSLDGVVLTMPPKDQTDRYNYCRFGEDSVYRLRGESSNPDLDGDDAYGKQCSIARCIPMWGGCSPGGLAIVKFHKTKKMQVDEWIQTLRSGAMKKAIQGMSPTKRNGPWHMLCDGEGFLRAKPVRKLYDKIGIKTWQVPPRSPDLNPIELFWAWLRKHLRAMDLKDAVAGRPVLGKMAYIARVRRVCATKKAQTVGKNVSLRLKKACQMVIKARGRAIKG